MALDIEPVILGRGRDPGNAVVDTAGELGVRHVLLASGPAERAAVVERFGELCDARPARRRRVVLEFLPIFTIGTLADAVSVVTGGRPSERCGPRRHAAPGPLGRGPDDLATCRPAAPLPAVGRRAGRAAGT